MNLTEVFCGRPDLLTDQKKLNSVLKDFYVGDIAKVNRMMKAYDLGIVDVLSNDASNELEKRKIIDRLVSLHDMQETKAIDAVSEWKTILNSELITIYKEYLQVQKKEKQKITEEQRKQNLPEDKEKQRQDNVEGIASSVSMDFNDYVRHYNLDLSKGIVYGVPCGVGNSDHGFIVKGTCSENINNNDLYPSVLAMTYNFLVRDTHISKDGLPQYLRMTRFNHELDYGHVFRYMMILLDLVNPSGETNLILNLIGDEDELTAAVEMLNEYLGVFARLSKSRACHLTVEIDPSAKKSISVETKADFYVENYTSDQGLRRRIRYGKRINYSLDESDRKDLEFLLREISPFKSFKKGQFAALCAMLNANDHAVCIMPTGSGKSLIYYLACLLQPQIVFVVSPTDILIQDQIRNLKKFHHFDSATHLYLNHNNDFAFYMPATSLVFLTPDTFQNKNLFDRFQRYKNSISYVVLDEIHCISNWGHDFRPEYLMLAKNIRKYLEGARYLGFTATANYTVAQDIQKQLEIPFENFISPVLFEKYNIKYDFREVVDMEAMYVEIKKISAEIIRKNEKALVFVKSNRVARQVADAIGYEADVFSKDNPESYSAFVHGTCRILVASEELGIGVNLPNVNCTVHFGMPVSKNEYVQEIGRAGRAEEKVTSYVIYLKPCENNVPAKLLKRETIIDNFSATMPSIDNDYSEIFRKLHFGADTSNVLYERLVDIYSDFHVGENKAYMINQPMDGIEQYKQLLYMLYVVGYVKDWYVYQATNENSVDIIIDICSVSNVSGHHAAVMGDNSMLERMKTVARGYFESMGNDRESMSKISAAKEIKEVIRIYVDWYYEKYLYHHKEQFLDFYEFITGNKDCDSVKITEDIEDYFTLPFIQIKEDEKYYRSLAFDEISKQAISGIGKNTLSNLEQINSDNYSYKLDYLLFAGRWAREGRFEESRLERFWKILSEEEKKEFLSTMAELYSGCTPEARVKFLNYVDAAKSVMDIELKDVMDNVYAKNPKDMVFYYFLAKKANRVFDTFRRAL